MTFKNLKKSDKFHLPGTHPDERWRKIDDHLALCLKSDDRAKSGTVFEADPEAEVEYPK